MIQEIDNWVSDKERLTLVDFIIANRDNFLSAGKENGVFNSETSIFFNDSVVTEILSPKIHALAGDCHVACWANHWFKGEGITPHIHSPSDQYIFSANLFLAGPSTGTSFASKTYINKEGTLMYFPSTMVHWVDRNPFDEPRISMGFDFIFQGKVDRHPAQFVEIKADKKPLIAAAW